MEVINGRAQTCFRNMTPMKTKQLFNRRVTRQIVGFYKMYFLLRSIRQPLNFILVFSKETPRLMFLGENPLVIVQIN
jgi:hypothetical protein